MIIGISALLVGLVLGVFLVCFVFTRTLRKYRKYQPLGFSSLEEELNAFISWVRKHG